MRAASRGPYHRIRLAVASVVAAVGLICATPVPAELPPTPRIEPEARGNRDSLPRASRSNVVKRELRRRIGRLMRVNRRRLRRATAGLVAQIVSVAGTLCFALKTHEQLGLLPSLAGGALLFGLSTAMVQRPLSRAKSALSDSWSTVIRRAQRHGLSQTEAEVLAGPWLAHPARAIKRNLANRLNSFWLGEAPVDATVDSLASQTPARTSSLIELLSRDGPGNED